MKHPDLEQKLLDILAQPETARPAGTEDEVDPEKLLEGMNEIDQKLLSRIMGSEMKSPSEIVEAQKIALHNERISKARAEKLARRRSRGSSNKGGPHD